MGMMPAYPRHPCYCRGIPGSTNRHTRFGAVMEEFEVRDALNAVFSVKPEISMV